MASPLQWTQLATPASLGLKLGLALPRCQPKNLRALGIELADSMPPSTAREENSWMVRPFDAGTDFHRSVHMLTDAFHDRPTMIFQLPFLESLAYNVFRAEVLDSLRSKMKEGSGDFAMLVAHEIRVESGDDDSNRSIDEESAKGSKKVKHLGNAVGIVELSRQASREVLSNLKKRGTIDPSSAYLSSMAVDSSFRRRGVATALIEACESVAQEWGQESLSLYVYEDNTCALSLYEGMGFRVVWRDPGWRKLVPGARTRLLMLKYLQHIDQT